METGNLAPQHLAMLEARGLDAELLVRLGAINFVTLDGESGCWLWNGPMLNSGYGRHAATTAHRAFYCARHGAVPADLEIDHLCRNKRCVNPAHLEPVTKIENMRRYIATKAACPQGHPWMPENIRQERRGNRRCRACHNERERLRQAAIRRAARA